MLSKWPKCFSGGPKGQNFAQSGHSGSRHKVILSPTVSIVCIRTYTLFPSRQQLLCLFEQVEAAFFLSVLIGECHVRSKLGSCLLKLRNFESKNRFVLPSFFPDAGTHEKKKVLAALTDYSGRRALLVLYHRRSK